MKIGHSADKPAPPAAPAAVAATSASTTAAVAVGTAAIPAQADASAKIELSNTASTLLTHGTTPEFDAEKVARISKSIEDGSFKINPEAIADKLIANAQEVLSKTQP
jgi:negative regulator of flagellin synthesis FlgM